MTARDEIAAIYRQCEVIASIREELRRASLRLGQGARGIGGGSGSRSGSKSGAAGTPIPVRPFNLPRSTT